jgi:hypothetical protein
MERFVGLLVAGGLALVAGLWILALAPGGNPARYAGAALALAGAVALGVAIQSQVDASIR